MDDRRFDQEPEPELEHLLAEGLSVPPPENILREITPWRKAMKRILIGVALDTITLNFWMLDYLLPAVGHILLLLGLRPLRRENRAFRVWWYSMLLQTGLWAFRLIRQAAPGWQAFDQTALGQELIWLGIALQFVQFLCLWLGLRAVRRDAGLTPSVRSGGALLVFYCILLWLGLIGAQIGVLFFFALLAVYICIFRSLYKLSRELEEAGYTLRPAPVWVPDWPLAGGILAALLLGIIAAGLTCNRLPMDWQPVDPSEHSQVEDLKAQLQDLGFPEEVLADLSAGDIQSCDGAVRVVSDTNSFALTYQVAGEAPKPLTITSVAVELAGEQERWRIFHHFQWETGVRFYNTEAMQFRPAYHINEGWFKSSDAAGRVLYDRDGATLWSPYYFLGEEVFTSNNIFFGAQTSADLFASFSFPKHGERCRGYVTYEATESLDGCIIDSWVSYAHARMMFQYPALSAKDWLQTGSIFDNWEPFRCIQTVLQFFPQELDEADMF